MEWTSISTRRPRGGLLSSREFGKRVVDNSDTEICGDRRRDEDGYCDEGSINLDRDIDAQSDIVLTTEYEYDYIKPGSSTHKQQKPYHRRIQPSSFLRMILSTTLLLLTLTSFSTPALASAHSQASNHNNSLDSHKQYENSTALADGAPRCAHFCYPFDPTYFSNGVLPCEAHKDTTKWVPCLCTDRPFVRFIADCVFRKCGPAIPSAIDFAYKTCEEHGVSLPPPKEVIEELNIAMPNDAIGIPDEEELDGMKGPFAEVFPEPVNGASKSDDDPGLTRNRILEEQSAGVVVKVFGEAGKFGRVMGILGVIWIVVSGGLIWER